MHKETCFEFFYQYQETDLLMEFYRLTYILSINNIIQNHTP